MAKAKAAPVAVTSILVAVRHLVGPITVEAGEELTAEKLKDLKLTEDDVDQLLDRGDIERQSVRVAESDDGLALGKAMADLEAAEARAAKAEAEVKTLAAKVADLEKQLEAAKKPA